MRILPCLLFPWFLAAQEPADLRGLVLDLQTELGADPLARIHLAPPGCWDGLLLTGRILPAKPSRQGMAGATVEVWDMAPREPARDTAFGLYLGSLRERLSRALALPPPSHAAIELGDLMLSDPSSPQKLDLTRVKSMQERFNRLPPNGSPVR